MGPALKFSVLFVLFFFLVFFFPLFLGKKPKIEALKVPGGPVPNTRPPVPELPWAPSLLTLSGRGGALVLGRELGGTQGCPGLGAAALWGGGP